MNTRYKFIHFEPSGRTPRPVWSCINNRAGDVLAHLYWYQPWRQYVMQADPDAVFSADCLADIQHFIGQLAGQPAVPLSQPGK